MAPSPLRTRRLSGKSPPLTQRGRRLFEAPCRRLSSFLPLLALLSSSLFLAPSHAAHASVSPHAVIPSRSGMSWPAVTTRNDGALSSSAVARRELQTIQVDALFAFCWRDVKKPNGAQCPTNYTWAIQKSTGVCLYNCKDTGRFTCGPACADTKKICVEGWLNGFITTGIWMANFIVPGSGAASKITKLIGYDFTNATSPTNISLTTLDMTNIFLQTYGARTQVAAQLALYQQVVQTDPSQAVPIQVGINLAGRALKLLNKYGLVFNIESVAAADPSGTVNVLMSWLHTRCSTSDCAKCSLVYHTCQGMRQCSDGVCGAPTQMPNGTACIISDVYGNTLPGVCQSGTCNASVTQSFVLEQEKKYILWPDGRNLADKLQAHVEINPTLFQTVGVDKVTSLMYSLWNQTAWDENSCKFLNGGCNTSPCVINPTTKQKSCIDPATYGYKPGPYAVDFAFLSTLEVLPNAVTPMDCMTACNQAGSNCTMVVTTQSGTCILKNEPYSGTGNLAFAPFYQAYIKG